jgi:transposase
MGKAYSVDLRQRVLSALDNGMSKMQAHKTFQVSRSTIDDWLRLREQTGHLQDAPRQPRSTGHSLATQDGFVAFAQSHQHCTLEQMSVAWQQQTQQRFSGMSFSRALRQHGFTRKERATSTGSGVSPNARLSPSK